MSSVIAEAKNACVVHKNKPHWFSCSLILSLVPYKV